MNHRLNRPRIWQLTLCSERETGREMRKDKKERSEEIKLGRSLIQPLTIIRRLWWATDQKWHVPPPPTHTHIQSVTVWQCSSDTTHNKLVPLCQSLAGVLGPEGTQLENKYLTCNHLAPQAVFHASLDQTTGLVHWELCRYLELNQF